MELINYAKELELKGYEYYVILAQESTIGEISGIFTFLAKEEKRHYEILDSWQQNIKIPAIENENIMENVNEVFQKLTDQFRGASFVAIDRDDAYEKALEFENKSISHYTKALERLGPGKEHETQRTMLQSIINQEKIHAQLITSLMEFQRHPGEWLENAEWYHFEEY